MDEVAAFLDCRAPIVVDAHLATMDRAGVVRAADFRLQSFLVHILYPELTRLTPSGTSRSIQPARRRLHEKTALPIVGG